MAGLLEDMSPQQYGLLMTGLGMMANSRGRTVGEAFGAGGMQGLQAMTVQQQQQQMNALRAAQEKRYQALAEQDQRQAEQQAARQQVMQGVDPKNPDSLMKGLMAIGDYETALKINKRPNGVEEALWASGGDENQARQLLQNKIQNPLGMLNYQLQAGNMQADNARANESLNLQRQEIELRRLNQNQNSDLDRQLKQVQLEKAQRDLSGKSPDIGRSNVTETIAGLRDIYVQLKEKGAITDTANDELSNLSAGLASSSVGQSIGKMFGTEAQSLRNTIAQQRPILLQQIMKATGMSAKQMDSNAELKLYLSTATDPHLDIQSNIRALDMLEKLYGIDTTQQKEEAANKMPESGGGVVVDIKEPGSLTPENKAALNADVEKEKARIERRKKYLKQ